MSKINELRRMADRLEELHRDQWLPDGTAIRPAELLVSDDDLRLAGTMRAWLDGHNVAREAITLDELLEAGQKIIERVVGKPAHPLISSASDVKTLDDLIECLRLRRATQEAIRSPTATEGDHAVWQEVTATTKGYERVTGAQELRGIANERYGTELTLESAIMLRGVYARLVEKTSDEAGATPLVDVVAKLLEPAGPPKANGKEYVTLADIESVARTPSKKTIGNHRAGAKAGRAIPEPIKTGGTGEDVYPYPELREWLIAEFPKLCLNERLPEAFAEFCGIRKNVQ
jgi:hypothetical protein